MQVQKYQTLIIYSNNNIFESIEQCYSCAFSDNNPAVAILLSLVPGQIRSCLVFDFKAAS